MAMATPNYATIINSCDGPLVTGFEGILNFYP